MSADLYIHVLDGCTKQDVMTMASNVIGSKYCGRYHQPKYDSKEYKAWRGRIDHTPNVWIGEVSWLKAAFLDDSETFVPSAVQAVSEVVGEDFPLIDDSLIARIRDGMALSNSTGYRVAKQDAVLAFLEKHRGKPVFTISW